MKPKHRASLGEAVYRMLAALAILMAATACSGVPDGVIAPKKMAKIMADVHVGEAVVEQNRADFNNDSLKQTLKQSIYKRHGVTQTEVEESQMWYGSHLDRYTEVYDMAREEIETRIAKAQEAAANSITERSIMSFEAEGDSVDVWTLYRSRNFSPNLSSDRLTFEIKSDRNWEPGDIYVLRFKTEGNSMPLRVSLAADYPGGEIRYATGNIRSDGWHEVTLCLNPKEAATNVYGSIAAPDERRKFNPLAPPVMVDSISLVRLRKDAPGVQRRRQYTFHHR